MYNIKFAGIRFVSIDTKGTPKNFDIVSQTS